MPGRWNDSEVTTVAGDSLDRAGYAARAAALIAENHSPDASIVYGLTGPWGSGKSSLINMIAEKLGTDPSAWTIARFTPWATSDVTGLLADFYASLASALPDQEFELRKTLGTMLTIAAPLAGLLPVGGSLVEKTAIAAADQMTRPKPWKEEFTEAATKLKRLGVSVLVVADDIDRLQGDELLAVLKVIRLLGRFPGVDYLLAYDEDTLFGTLSATGLVNRDGTAARFMEKIVQYPLVVPPLLPHQVEARLRFGMAEILEDAGRPVPEDLRWDSLIALLQGHLTTPRAIARFLAQVEHHLPALDTAEVDDCDVIGLTFLRMQYSTLYVQVPGLRDELTSGHTGEIALGGDGQPHYERFDPSGLLDTAVPETSRDGARRTLHLLFPRLLAEDDSLKEPVARKGIGDVSYFDRYFLLRIPAHDVSDKVVAAAVAAAGEGDATGIRNLLLAETESARAELAVSKAISLEDEVTASPSGDSRQLCLVKTLVPILEELPPRSQVADRRRMLVRRWVTDALLRLSADATQTGILEALDVACTPATKLEVLADVRNRMTDRSWFDPVLDEIERASVDQLTTHLRAQDAAPISDRPRFVIYRLTELDRRKQLADAIAQGLRHNDFSVDDVAARFVEVDWNSVARIDGGVISGFDQFLFEYYVDVEADTWFDSVAEDVDLTDTCWENLRRYAAGRARPRSAQHDDDSTGPASTTP